MSSDDSRQYERELNEAVDGGGCTETWQALSEMRRSGTAQGRRSFVKRVGLTIGAIPFASGGVGASSRQTADPDIDVNRLRGRQRGQLLRASNRSEQMRFVADQIGHRPGVDDVFEYAVEDDTGRGVTFGSADGDGPVLRYYESESFRGTNVRALGGVDLDGRGTAVRAVDGESGVVTDIHSAQATAAAERHAGGAADAASTEARGSVDLAFEEAILARDVTGADQPFDVYVPVFENGDVVDRVVVSGTGDPFDASTVEVAVGGNRTEDQVTTQGHVICDPTGNICTNYCTILCSALAGLAGAACTAKCSATIAGIPIAPGCGAVCAGVVASTCYPTCTNQVGH
jgi:hypothetical protein